VRRNLHLVLSFSPVGDAFRERLRKFPSLVHCTTLDWFTAWPRDALATVATNFLAGLPGADNKVGSSRSIRVCAAGAANAVCCTHEDGLACL
jgi:dynein heavy chain